MAILVSFWSIFGDRMANLGLIDFKICLHFKVNVTAGQNKFEVHIYQIAQNGHQLHKIGQMPLWRMDIIWPYLGRFSSNFDVIFYKCLFFKDKSNGDNN